MSLDAQSPQLKYYHRNRDKIKARRSSPAALARAAERARERYAQNPDRERKRQREWYATNADHRREYARAYYSANQEGLRAYNNARRRANPEKEREKHFRLNYGMTIAQRDAMFAAQGFRCAICRTDEPGRKVGWGWHVDHDHATNTVRAILCHHCNIALGAAKDDPVRLRAMAEYIERYRRP